MNAWRFPVAVLFFFLVHAGLFVRFSESEAFSVKSSTQFMWGDLFSGQTEPIISEMLRLNVESADKLKVNGYGRVSQDYGDGSIHNSGGTGRLFYLYMDYTGVKDFPIRLGRQLSYNSAGMLLVDGINLDLKKISKYVGVSATVGTEVQGALNSDYTTDKKQLATASFFLKNVGMNDAEFSYLLKFDAPDIARETFGFNGSSTFKWGKPYLHAIYNNLAQAFDAMTAGVDFYPTSRVAVKTEYYQAYPTFDATSIYSVFAVDQYSEYVARVSYDKSPKTNFFLSAKQQSYMENSSAFVASAGLSHRAGANSSLHATLDHRDGYGGYLWGGEAYGDYGLSEKLALSAGVQRDMYARPATADQWGTASRYWVGGRYAHKSNLSLNLRVEQNVNDRLGQLFGGRASLEAAF